MCELSLLRGGKFGFRLALLGNNRFDIEFCKKSLILSDFLLPPAFVVVHFDESLRNCIDDALRLGSMSKETRLATRIMT